MLHEKLSAKTSQLFYGSWKSSEWCKRTGNFVGSFITPLHFVLSCWWKVVTFWTTQVESQSYKNYITHVTQTSQFSKIIMICLWYWTKVLWVVLNFEDLLGFSFESITRLSLNTSNRLRSNNKTKMKYFLL